MHSVIGCVKPGAPQVTRTRLFFLPTARYALRTASRACRPKDVELAFKTTMARSSVTRQLRASAAYSASPEKPGKSMSDSATGHDESAALKSYSLTMED